LELLLRAADGAAAREVKNSSHYRFPGYPNHCRTNHGMSIMVTDSAPGFTRVF
jgi:hypothetical protein